MNHPDTPQTSRSSAAPRQAGKGSQPSQDAGTQGSPRARRLRIFAIVLCVPLILCLGYWLLGFVVLPDSAQVSELKGIVHMHGARDVIWRPTRINQLMRAKDWLRTAEGASARVRFLDVSTADLEESTEITIERLGQRRQRRAGDVGLKMWAGEMAVRAVRLLDASSSVRVETPTASTVVRGARFTVQVDAEGGTQIDLHEGSAKVRVSDEILSLGMGERLVIGPDGSYQRERFFEPNPRLLLDRIRTAWDAPGEVYRLEVPENEVNQFLAATSEQPGSAVRDAQIWFIDGEARFAATLVEPTEVDLVASIEMRVEGGRLVPQIRLHTAGVALPLPVALLERAVGSTIEQVQSQLDEAEAYVEFSEVRIEERRLLLVGRKRPPA